MTARQRMTLLGLAAAVVVAAVIVASTSSGGSGDTTTVTSTVAAPDRGATTAPHPPAPAPASASIEVKGGEPVGGVKDVSARKGERVSMVVSSPDYAGEIHLHGYDLSREVAPGKPARFAFTAAQEGVFEMEIEATSTPIASLTVHP